MDKPDDARVMLAAHILEEWDMKEPSNDYTGHSYEDIARDLLTRISSQARPDGELVEAREIETVTGDFGTEPGEPFWRIEIDGYCADFDYQAAADNFAAAINRRLSSERIAPQPDTELAGRVLVLESLVARAQQIVPDCYITWHGMAQSALSPERIAPQAERAQIVAWHRREAQRLHEAASKEADKVEPDDRFFRYLVDRSTTHVVCAAAIERGDHLASLTPSSDHAGSQP